MITGSLGGLQNCEWSALSFKSKDQNVLIVSNWYPFRWPERECWNSSAGATGCSIGLSPSFFASVLALGPTLGPLGATALVILPIQVIARVINSSSLYSKLRMIEMPSDATACQDCKIAFRPLLPHLGSNICWSQVELNIIVSYLRGCSCGERWLTQFVNSEGHYISQFDTKAGIKVQRFIGDFNLNIDHLKTLLTHKEVYWFRIVWNGNLGRGETIEFTSVINF